MAQSRRSCAATLHRRHPMILRTVAFATALALSAGAAVAQAPQGGPSPEPQAARAAVRQACAADIQALCAGKEGREAGQCLRENAAKASKPCQDALAKAPRPGPPPPPQQ